jgi:hypothetical protein
VIITSTPDFSDSDRCSPFSGEACEALDAANMLSMKDSMADEDTFMKMLGGNFGTMNPASSADHFANPNPSNGFVSGPPSMEMVCVKVSISQYFKVNINISLNKRTSSYT